MSLRKAAVITLVLPFAMACSALQAPASAAPPQQIAMIKATCSKVMRLTEGQAQFDGCVSTLADTLGRQIANERIAVAYHNCVDVGLKPGTPELSRCVLDREDMAISANAPNAIPAAMLTAANVRPADNDPGSYFTASLRTRHRREQYSCAQLGLEPDTEPFATCVSTLDTNLFNISYPPG